ncbi:tetratricopeptide repeat protein [Paraliomyxa miuraensis]|uniref:tetratricopeptide repeat protein n=1 Tax=Paraliomyxa miuraensis TaxID=376150 RepID=UPI0022508401|nr:tetratricopeptide repeat protein [Paraliomyxa miuraensis]MCX4247697.1 tetratricopeptide repeat protein [Paraliomyxa miuraensis]
MVRILTTGAWVWLAALGCAPKGAAEGSPTVAPGVAATTASSPTEQLEALRREIAQAGDRRAIEPERCSTWAEGLVELHRVHGEPYVGARLEAASLLRDCGQPDAARALLLESLDGMPRWARAEGLHTLGVVAREAGDDGGALVLLHEALRADPALHEVRASVVRLLLRFYEDGGSHFARDDAKRHLDTWLELAPEEPRVRVLEARLMMAIARREPEGAERLRQEAALQLHHVVAERPSPSIAAEAFVGLGRLHLDHGNEVDALKAFKRALELDPGRADAALPGATAALHMRDFLTAREMLVAAARTVDLGEEHERLRLLAVALRGLRRYDDAAAIYDQLLAKPEPDPVDMYNRAHLELYRFEADTDAFDPDRVRAAREWFTKAIDAARGNPAHEELVRRSELEIHAIDELMSDVTVHRTLDEEAARLEALERKAWPEERKRRLKLEKQARAAFEHEQAQNTPTR